MKKLFLIVALFAGRAKAAGIEAVGGGSNPSINQMWNDATSMLPYRGLGGQGVQLVVGLIVNTVTWFIGVSAVIIILVAALYMVTGAGNEEKIGKGKKLILYAAVGLILAVLTNAIINYVAGFVATLT